MIFLLDLANELIFEIVQHLEQRDIKSLACISVNYYNTFIDDVYHFNITSRGGCGILWAIRQDQATTVAKFLKLGLDVNATPDLDRSSLLHTAAYHGSLSTVKLLLLKGADINARTLSGTTPLFNALENRHEQVTYFLSRHIPDMSKAFVNVARALTPLHAACQFKFANAAKLFLELGADLAAKDAEGMTPLYHALSCHTFSCRRVDNDAVFRTLTVLVEFGATQDLQAMESPPNYPSTFHLGYNHEDRRVRQLLFYRQKDNTPAMGRAFRIGRAWMSEDIEHDHMLSNESSQHGNSSQSLGDYLSLSTEPSEALVSLLSGHDNAPLGPQFDTEAENAELSGDPFPSLPSGLLPSPEISTPSTTGKWSQSNVEHLISKIRLAETRSKIPAVQKVQHLDPFPQLFGKVTLQNDPVKAKEKWANFLKPADENTFEKSQSLNPDSGGQAGEEKRHSKKARGKKSWKPVQLW